MCLISPQTMGIFAQVVQNAGERSQQHKPVYKAIEVVGQPKETRTLSHVSPIICRGLVPRERARYDLTESPHFQRPGRLQLY